MPSPSKRSRPKKLGAIFVIKIIFSIRIIIFTVLQWINILLGRNRIFVVLYYIIIKFIYFNPKRCLGWPNVENVRWCSIRKLKGSLKCIWNVTANLNHSEDNLKYSFEWYWPDSADSGPLLNLLSNSTKTTIDFSMQTIPKSSWFQNKRLSQLSNLKIKVNLCFWKNLSSGIFRNTWVPDFSVPGGSRVHIRNSVPVPKIRA